LASESTNGPRSPQRLVSFSTPKRNDSSLKKRNSESPRPRELDAMMEVFLRSNEQNSSRLYKILVVGEVHSGKSAIIRRHVHNFFSDSYRSTVGVDFHLKIVPYNEELEVRMQLWDIAGQERFSAMTRAYFKGAVGALVVFDSGDSHTYSAARKWKVDIDKKCALPDGRKIPAILIANKCDLERGVGMPDDTAISEFAQEAGFVPKWYRTSAKTGEGIDEAMRMMLKYIMAVDTWNRPLRNPDEDEASVSGVTTLSGATLVEADETVKLEDNAEKRSRPCNC